MRLACLESPKGLNKKETKPEKSSRKADRLGKRHKQTSNRKPKTQNSQIELLNSVKNRTKINYVSEPQNLEEQEF
jgi:hypothetical protein